MALTPRGIWTPDSGEEYDLTIDAATTAGTVDAALQKAANYGLGTTAEMNAAVGEFPDGALWFNTTSNTEYRRVAGAWEPLDTGWVSGTSWLVGGAGESSSTPVKGRITDSVRVSLTGAVTGVSIPASGSLDILQMPAQFRPATTSYNPLLSAGGTSSLGWIIVYSNGIVSATNGNSSGSMTVVRLDAVDYWLD